MNTETLETLETSSFTQEELTIFPGLAEKFAVDLASSIIVSDDHLRVKEEQGWLVRLYAAISGKTHLRDIEIQKNLVSGQEASMEWLLKLTNDHVHSNLAITRVQKAVIHIRENLAETINFSVDTREQLQKLEEVVGTRIKMLSGRVKYLEVQTHIAHAISKLEGGRYSELPLLPGIYAVLDELYWGEFGDYLRDKTINDDRKKKSREYMADKLIALVRNKISEERQPIERWMKIKSERSNKHEDCIAYLGTWADKDIHPFSFASTQPAATLPLAIPLRLDAMRAVNAMQIEMFEERAA